MYPVADTAHKGYNHGIQQTEAKGDKMSIEITYYGHSCFTLKAAGYTIALDPYDGSVPGYRPLRITADQVFCSHGHGDHCFTEAVTLTGKEDCPFQITEIPSFHDPDGGKLRGENTIRVFACEGIRVAHFGDLGCCLTDEQMKQLQGLDAALLPVGGTYTITADEAKKLADALDPRVVIPMHYRSGQFGYDVIAPLDEFTNLYTEPKAGGRIEKACRTIADRSFLICKDTAPGVCILNNNQ